MALDARKELILSMLSDRKTILLRDLGEELHYSPATLRRVVSSLEDEGLLRRTHGRIHCIETAQYDVPPALDRQAINLSTKHVIACAAATLVSDRSTIILDSGTTTALIARELKEKSLTVATNSLEAAQILAHTQSKVYCCGGLLQPDHMCFVGPTAERFFTAIEAEVLFLGSSGVRTSQGLTTSSPLQYNIKQAMLRAARKKVAAVDLSKFSSSSLFTFAPFSQINVLITNRPRSGSREEGMLRDIAALGVEVILAEDLTQNTNLPDGE